MIAHSAMDSDFVSSSWFGISGNLSCIIFLASCCISSAKLSASMTVHSRLFIFPDVKEIIQYDR